MYYHKVICGKEQIARHMYDRVTWHWRRRWGLFASPPISIFLRARKANCSPPPLRRREQTITAMFRLALTRVIAGARVLASKSQFSATSYSLGAAATRFYGTNGQGSSQQEAVARQMIQYAFSHARSQKSGESYAQAMLVLEQGLSNLRAGGGDSGEDAMGMLMLAMSTLLYERGDIQDAMEKLQMVQQLGHASLPVKVAAFEGLIGLKLESGEDNSSQVLVEDCFQVLKNGIDDDVFASSGAVNLQAKAIKVLVDLVLNGPKAAELSSTDQGGNLQDVNDQIGNAAFSYGEYLHASGNVSLAKNLYERAINVFESEERSDYSYLMSANMAPEEVLLGVTCALGQLLSQSGKFHEAEELLTKALTKAENHFGLSHPKVGVVLTCIALMFKHKARMEGSSSILIQEGLYRRAIDLLKAPALDSEVKDIQVEKRDIVALARGGFADLLCIQQNRKGEGERMRKWAEATWRNRRLSLAQALEFSEPSHAAVVDTRISRVL